MQFSSLKRSLIVLAFISCGTTYSCSEPSSAPQGLSSFSTAKNYADRNMPKVIKFLYPYRDIQRLLSPGHWVACAFESALEPYLANMGERQKTICRSVAAFMRLTNEGNIFSEFSEHAANYLPSGAAQGLFQDITLGTLAYDCANIGWKGLVAWYDGYAPVQKSMGKMISCWSHHYHEGGEGEIWEQEEFVCGMAEFLSGAFPALMHMWDFGSDEFKNIGLPFGRVFGTPVTKYDLMELSKIMIPAIKLKYHFGLPLEELDPYIKWNLIRFCLKRIILTVVLDRERIANRIDFPLDWLKERLRYYRNKIGYLRMILHIRSDDEKFAWETQRNSTHKDIWRGVEDLLSSYFELVEVLKGTSLAISEEDIRGLLVVLNELSDNNQKMNQESMRQESMKLMLENCINNNWVLSDKLYSYYVQLLKLLSTHEQAVRVLRRIGCYHVNLILMQQTQCKPAIKKENSDTELLDQIAIAIDRLFYISGPDLEHFADRVLDTVFDDLRKNSEDARFIFLNQKHLHPSFIAGFSDFVPQNLADVILLINVNKRYARVRRERGSGRRTKTRSSSRVPEGGLLDS